jgi:hypothetical protein
MKTQAPGVGNSVALQTIGFRFTTVEGSPPKASSVSSDGKAPGDATETLEQFARRVANNVEAFSSQDRRKLAPQKRASLS